MATAITTHGIAFKAEVGVGVGVGVVAGAVVPEESEIGADLWNDGHQRLEKGAILHLLPPLMISGARLLTVLLNSALRSRRSEMMPMKRWVRGMIKRWVVIDYVLASPIFLPDSSSCWSDPADILHFRPCKYCHHVQRCLYHFDLCLS